MGPGSCTAASNMEQWRTVTRPGYFGRRRNQILLGYDANFGPGNWRLVWMAPDAATGSNLMLDFVAACQQFYQESYVYYLQQHPKETDFICEFTECIDNSPSNIHSGCDYNIQESTATHIQDIAVRNALQILGRTFTAKRTELLVIRSHSSNGYRFSPGNIPFHRPEAIKQPSKRPLWAQPRSVEDFWQSNKYLQVRADT